MRKLPFLITILGLFVLLVPSDSLHLSAVEQISFTYQYRLGQWELVNLPRKWYHRVAAQVTRNSPSRVKDIEKLLDLFHLRDVESRLVEKSKLLASGQASPMLIRQNQLELKRTRTQRDDVTDEAEEFLERELSRVLQEQNILLGVGPFHLQLPPVDFVLQPTPRLLVTSLRDRIERVDSILIQPTLEEIQMELLEDNILILQDLSALVMMIGGVATYPAMVPDHYSLRVTLQVAAHEWFHHYFFFRPLGQQYSKSVTMLTLNETAADLAGRELGDLVYRRIVGPLADLQYTPNNVLSPEKSPEIDVFEREMRKTRLRVDDLLEQGRVEEAETYMEEQRRLLMEKGFYIRKLNQAYFAFHGVYAQSPASTSPVRDKMPELRDTFESLGEFVRAITEVVSYGQFQELLLEQRDKK